MSVSSCCRTICLLVLSFYPSPKKTLTHVAHSFQPSPPLCKHSLAADSSCCGRHNALGLELRGGGSQAGGGGARSAGFSHPPTPFNSPHRPPPQPPDPTPPTPTHLTPGRPLAPGPGAWLQPRTARSAPSESPLRRRQTRPASGSILRVGWVN